MTNIEDKAFLIHKRHYRDNSVLATLFTKENGLIQTVIGGLNNKKNNKRAYLQLLQELNVTYKYKEHSLSNIRSLDIEETLNINFSSIIFCQYLNELLILTLPKNIPNRELFISYKKSLLLISEDLPISGIRLFEISVIKQTAGIPCIKRTIDTKKDISPNEKYYFYPQQGISKSQLITEEKPLYLNGEVFLNFIDIQENPINEEKAKSIGRLIKFWIDTLLNGKRLKTREIYKQIASTK